MLVIEHFINSEPQLEPASSVTVFKLGMGPRPLLGICTEQPKSTVQVEDSASDAVTRLSLCRGGGWSLEVFVIPDSVVVYYPGHSRVPPWIKRHRAEMPRLSSMAQWLNSTEANNLNG